MIKFKGFSFQWHGAPKFTDRPACHLSELAQIHLTSPRLFEELASPVTFRWFRDKLAVFTAKLKKMK